MGVISSLRPICLDLWGAIFDLEGISAIEVETHLDTISLGQEVAKATGGRMKLDRSTENLLAFNADGSKSVILCTVSL